MLCRGNLPPAFPPVGEIKESGVSEIPIELVHTRFYVRVCDCGFRQLQSPYEPVDDAVVHDSTRERLDAALLPSGLRVSEIKVGSLVPQPATAGAVGVHISAVGFLVTGVSLRVSEVCSTTK